MSEETQTMTVKLEDFLQERFANRLVAKNPINPKVFKYIPFFEEVFGKEALPVLTKLAGHDGISYIEHKTLKPRQRIIRKGEFDMMVFWLLKGSVDVVGTINNRPTIFKKYDKVGHCFGEIAIIDEGERTADVVASDQGAAILEIDWSIAGICRELQGKFTKLILKTINKKLVESFNSTKQAYAALQILQDESLTQASEIQRLRALLIKNGIGWTEDPLDSTTAM